MREQLRANQLAKYLNTKTSITSLCDVFGNYIESGPDGAYLYVQSISDNPIVDSANKPLARAMLIQFTIVAPKKLASGLTPEDYILDIVDVLNDELVGSGCFALHDIGNGNYIDGVEQGVGTPLLYINDRALKRQNYLVTYGA